MIPTYAGGTSNLIHLEAKHSVEYSKAKNSEADETDKSSMKQLPLAIGSSNAKKYSLAFTKEINAAVSDFIALD